MPTGEIELEIQNIVGIEFNAASKRPGDKRSYSTMAQQNYTGITSTEYKMASEWYSGIIEARSVCVRGVITSFHG